MTSFLSYIIALYCIVLKMHFSIIEYTQCTSCACIYHASCSSKFVCIMQHSLHTSSIQCILHCMHQAQSYTSCRYYTSVLLLKIVVLLTLVRTDRRTDRQADRLTDIVTQKIHYTDTISNNLLYHL